MSDFTLLEIWRNDYESRLKMLLLRISQKLGGELKASKLAIFICVLFGTISGCDSDLIDIPPKKPIEIISVEILEKGEPDGFRGKAVRISTSEKLGRRTVTYKIKIITNNGFEVNGNGYLSSMSSPHESTGTVLENMYLWVPRNDKGDLWRVITEEVKPNNVKSLKISIFEYNEELENFVFTDL